MKIAVTGGHHTSALPVIKRFREENPNVELIWFGHKHSLKGDKNTTLEYRDITDLGIRFIDLPAGKFYRTYDPVRLLKIPLGFIVATYHLLKNRPNAILSFGGYIAVPVVISGWFLGIPSITHEQTVVVGYANKLISKFAKKILISHEESSKYFPPEKTVLSGLPLRKELFEVRSDEFGLENDLPVLYITAGKTGSHKINSVVADCLSDLLQRFNVIHQCGDYSRYDDYSNLKKTYELLLHEDKKENNQSEYPRGKYFVRKFIGKDIIGEVFSKSDILLSRAGAHITAEIKAFGKAAVLVPIPWVSHNEQYLNASLLEDMGLAVILNENELSCENLLEKLDEVYYSIEVGHENIKYDHGPADVICREVLSLM